MAKILDDFYGKNLFRGGTIASNHDFFLSRVLLVCYVENGQKCQVNLILKNQYLPICLFFFSRLNGYKTLFLYSKRSEIMYNLVNKILFSNIFLSNFSKITLKIVVRMMMHTCRKNSSD